MRMGRVASKESQPSAGCDGHPFRLSDQLPQLGGGGQVREVVDLGRGDAVGDGPVSRSVS